MAETSKNNIYYNDDENSKADILADMKKMAESTDKAIENSKYNDTQIKKDISNMKTEIAAKDNEQDNKILQLQTEKAELEKELKEAQEDFYQNSIRGQASGEYIHVEDSSNCRAKIGIGGNQEQETRAGYNKLNMSNAKGGTSGGITCVINEDGSYQFKGTATTTDNGTVNVWFLGYYNSEAPTLFTLEAGTYYINDVVLFSGIKQLNKPLTKIYTFTSAVNITGVRAMSATAGQTYNEVKYPIIAKSNKELTWEQYGAMPSPDYPSEIKTVGDNVNLYDKDNEIVCNGIGIGSSSELFSRSDQKLLIIPISQGKTNIAISFTKTFSHSLRYAFSNSIVENVNSEIFDVDYVTDSTKTDVKVSKTITNNKYKYLLLSFIKSDNYPDLKIEYNSTPTSYSSYDQGSVKVTKCNKNLYDENNKLMNATINSNGIIATGQDNYLFYFPVEYGHKYIFSTDFSESLTTNIVFGYCSEIPSIGVLSTYNVISLSNLKNKIFTPIDEKNKYLCIRLNYKTQYNKMSNIQLEENTVSTSYKEHQEQSYIMPVQQEMLEGDYFDFDNEEEVHIFDKKVLTGNENWSRGTTRKGFYYFDYSDNNFVGSYNAKSDIFCNIAEKISASDLYEITSQKYLIAVYTKTLRLSLNNISTVDELKSYLKAQYDAGIPVVVYYKLATPNRLKFTDEQKAVAKELNNARTYKNVTNITTDSKAILSLDYAKDLETQNQKMQNEIDEIKQLLSTTQTSALLLDNMQTDIESEVE